MFDGQITKNGDGPVSEGMVSEAVRFAETVRQMKEAAGLRQYTKGFDLSEGGQVYVVDLEHTRNVHIIPPRPVREVDFPSTELDMVGVPDELRIIGFVSGGAYTGVTERDEEGVERIIENRVEPLPGGAAEARTAELFTPAEVARKVAVPQHSMFAVPGDEVSRSQLDAVQPGRYTGPMASVVQLLLGVGRMRPDDYERRFLQAEELPELALEDVTMLDSAGEVIREDEPDEVETIARLGEDEEAKLQIRYDYRWNRTHGIMWGRRDVTEELVVQAEMDGMPPYLVADPERRHEPFLVEMGQRGVLAMPLPRDEMSFFEEVRDQYRRVYPDLARHTPFHGRRKGLFEALGGFPTGGAFPEDPEELERWVRAGVVVRVDDALEDFYEGAAFATSHGWAFADSGNRATNTCYKQVDGLRHGVCYIATVEIEQRDDIELNPAADEFVDFFGIDDPVDIFKAYRLTTEQLLEINTYEEFDEMEAKPDWEVSVTLTEIFSGPIENNTPTCARDDPCIGVGPQYKIWEPMLHQMLTFDFYGAAAERSVPPADGPIFSTFVEDVLEMLCFYSDHSGAETRSIDTRQRCQYVGSWQNGSVTERSGLDGSFYSTTIDPRVAGSRASGTITTTTGREIGRADFASTCAFFAMSISLSRRVFGVEDWERESWSTHSVSTSIVCARNNRSAYFMGVWERTQELQRSRGFSGRKQIGTTGTTIVGSLYNFVFHWEGSCGDPCSSQDAWAECSRHTSFSCFGDDPPSHFGYSVQGGNRPNNPLIIRSPVGDNAVIGAGYYTPMPKAPDSWSETDPAVNRIEFRVYGMGLPEMNGRVLREREWEWQSGEPQPGGPDRDWIDCSLEDCPAMPWDVLRNYYGVPFLRTTEEFGAGVVEYGHEPRIPVTPGMILFGVVT